MRPFSGVPAGTDDRGTFAAFEDVGDGAVVGVKGVEKACVLDAEEVVVGGGALGVDGVEVEVEVEGEVLEMVVVKGRLGWWVGWLTGCLLRRGGSNESVGRLVLVAARYMQCWQIMAWVMSPSSKLQL